MKSYAAAKERYFHFLLSLAYPIDRPDWALFSVVILFCYWRKLKFGPLFCPATSPRFSSFLRCGAKSPSLLLLDCLWDNPNKVGSVSGASNAVVDISGVAENLRLA